MIVTGGIDFWDGSKRRNWFMMRAVARKIVARPAMLGEMERCVEENWASDPSKTRPLALWRKVVKLPPEAFATATLADTPEAQETRESFPPYGALTASERADYLEAARREGVRP